MDKTRLLRDYEKEPLALGEKPEKEDLEYLYLELNWSRDEIAKLIGKSSAQTKKYLAAHGFRKTQAQKLELRKRTNLEKYGVENISQLQSIKDKKEQRALEKYGCKNVSQSKAIKDKIKQTNLERYGVENAAQSKEVQAKIKKTNLEKYGVESAVLSKEVQDKIKQTNLERYGHESATKSEKVQNKIKQTNLERYGCVNPLQSKEIQDKIKKNNQEKYGVDWSAQREDVKEKIKQTNLERYGYTTSSKSPEVKAKTKATCLRKYGVNYPIANKLVQERARQTNLEKYGTEYAAASDIIRAKIKQTNLERYGAESNLSLEENKEKVKQTNLEKYGFESPMQNEDILNKAKQTNIEKYGYDNPMKDPKVIEKQLKTKLSPIAFKVLASAETLKEFIESNEDKDITTLARKLDIAYSTLNVYCHKYNLWNSVDHASSRYEAELHAMFPFMHKTKSAIPPYEIDLYSEEHRFGIEFNGNYWHSELKLPITYHQKKSLLAEENGIFLYHIFEYEWENPRTKEIILSQINNILDLNNSRIFARKCELELISSQSTREFLDQNHLQGYVSSSVNIGLFYENELVSVMTFGKPRFNTEHEWELIRYCSKKGVTVVGGASKLFKHFLNLHQPKSIISYSHIDKGTGKLYENLGFKLQKITSPDYVWCDGENVFSRYQCQKHKLIKMGFEGSSEREIMENLGFFRVFSCGNKVWSFSL